MAFFTSRRLSNTFLTSSPSPSSQQHLLLHPSSASFFNMSHLVKRSFLSVPLKQKACFCSSSIASKYDWKLNKGNRTIFQETRALANNLLLNDFLKDIFKQNTVVSPVSLHLILSLLAAGSGVSGRRQFLDFFHVDEMHDINASVSLLNDFLLRDCPDSSFGPHIRSSTSLWHHHSLSLHPFFLNSLYSPHRVSLIPLDFQGKTHLARQEINSRVERDTNGLIKDLLSEEYLSNPSVKLVFTNVLHYKGDWDIDGMLNQKREDHVDLAINLAIPENLAVAKNLPVAEIFAVKRTIFQRPRGIHINGNLFRRPNKDERGVTMLCCYPLRPDGSDPYHDETVVEVAGRKIPKFDVSYDVDASDSLRELGVTLPFSGGELTQILSSAEQLYVFKMLHKSFIDVNEEGTEAATATTAIVMSGRPPYRADPRILEKSYSSVLFDLKPRCDFPEFPSLHIARVGLKVHQCV